MSSKAFKEQKLLIQSVVVHGVNQFIQHPELTRTMLQTCMLCGQWVASHRVMKLHYRHTHAQTLQALQHRASRIVQQRATPCATCHFCGGKHKDWKAHLHKCTALWQCSILCAQYEQQHDGRADGGVLWGCQEGGGLLGPMERICSFDARSPQSLRNAQRQATARTVQGQSASSGAAAVSFSVRPAADQGSLAYYFGQGSSATAGGAPGTAAGHQLHSFHEARRGRGDERAVQSSTDLQGQAGGGAHVAVRPTASPHGSDYDHVQGTNRSLESNAGIPGETQASYGQRTAGLHRLEVPKVERFAEAAGGGLFEATHTGRSHAGSPRHHHSMPQAPDHHQVPVQEKTDGNHDVPNHLPARLLDISLRCHSAITMWDTMKILQNNAVFQLGGLAYKPESLGSGAQEKQIRDMVFSRT